MTDDLTRTALIPLPPDGGEVALPDELIERAKSYMAEALSVRTRACYARWWRVFDGWCEVRGRQSLPASPETIIVDLLSMFNDKRVIHTRNRALILVGWAAALRRSELVGLDVERAGDGIGYVQVDERGLLNTLLRSKASQDRVESTVVPRADVPEACEALEAWVQRAGLKPGQPLFSPVNNRSQIAATRLTSHSVSRIVKRCMRDRARKRGKTIEEAKEFVRRCSGHSLRAGYATSAADADIPSLRIQKHCRHKSADMTARYVRISQAWTKSGLKGILRRTTAGETP